MRVTGRLREEMRRSKAAQAATGLSVLVADGLRRLPGSFRAVQRRAERRDTAVLRGRAAGYAERAAGYAERAATQATKAYERLAERGRDAMNDKRV